MPLQIMRHGRQEAVRVDAILVGANVRGEGGVVVFPSNHLWFI